jgi:hypothetical protein
MTPPKSGLPQPVMSALPPKADTCSALANVGYGPKADMFLAQKMSAKKFEHHALYVKVSFEGRPLGYVHIGRQALRSAYRFLFATAFAVGISTMPAAAEVLYLKCQFADYICSTQTFRINLKTGAWGSYCPGKAFQRAKYRARINNETIFLPSADNDEYVSVNRVTGDAVILQKLKGVCRKEGK